MKTEQTIGGGDRTIGRQDLDAAIYDGARATQSPFCVYPCPYIYTYK